MIKKILPLLVLVGIFGIFNLSIFAEMSDCQMILDTLKMCIEHHWDMGQIHSIGVYHSLLSKADTAVSANEQGQIKTSINILNAFINEVNAQNGKSVDSEAAEHMIMHVKSVISSMQNP